MEDRAVTRPDWEDGAEPREAAPSSARTEPALEKQLKRPRRRGVPISVIGRVVLTGLAVIAGLLGSEKIEMGTALSADRYIAGSVAILAVATGMSGILILLVGSGGDRSHAISWVVRVVGFLLAFVGILAAVTLLFRYREAVPPGRVIRVPDQTRRMPDMEMGPGMFEVGPEGPGPPPFPGPRGDGPEAGGFRPPPGGPPEEPPARAPRRPP